MDLASFIDRYYQSSIIHFDQLYTYSPEFATLTAFMQNELVLSLSMSDSWDEVADGIFTEDEVDFIYRELQSFL
jgi:hypothetical protein